MKKLVKKEKRHNKTTQSAIFGKKNWLRMKENFRGCDLSWL